MSNKKAHQEAKPQTIQATSPVLIDSTVTGKKECLHILHVDDDVSLLEVSKQILSMENNFQIDTALSVDEAFRKMEKQPYDVIVSDYEMPLKTGLEFLKDLREQKNEVPFILFTGKGREEVAVKALNLSADSYINKNGSPETVYCELTDAINKAAERKKSRQLLTKSELKYRTLVEKSLQGILVALPKPLKYVFANSAIEKMLGYSSQELMSLSPEEIMSLVYSEDRTIFFKRLEDRLNGEPANSCYEFRAVRKDGSIIWLSVLSERVDYDGQPAVMGMFLDITESRKHEESVRKSEQRYRDLANFLPGLVYESDLTKVTFVNKRVFEVTGYTEEEINDAMNTLAFIAPEDQERLREMWVKTLNPVIEECPDRKGPDKSLDIECEFTLVKKDGTRYPALIMSSPIISENELTGFRGLVIDITERKKAEENVRKSEQRYRDLANFLPGVVFERDLNGVTYVNRHAFEMTGYTTEELQSDSDMMLFVLPEDQEKVIENVKKILIAENLGIVEFTIVKKDGTTFPALIMISPVISEGEVTGFRGVVMDITERKKAEEALNQTMNKLAIVNEKLRVVGSLTRHDVRNKLSIVTGNAFLLKKKHADQPDIIDRIGKIEQASKEIERILDFAKMYEQLGVEELTFIDVEAKLKEAYSLFSYPLPQIINECQGLTVLADSFLRQLFYNFIDNTLKYGKKTTTINVYFEKTDQDSLKLVYEDDGIGISFENKKSLFTEGFSTGGSTGFGLFLSKKMMDVYDWKIEENGEPGKGAKFTMTIPRFNKNGKETFQIKSKNMILRNDDAVPLRLEKG